MRSSLELSLLPRIDCPMLCRLALLCGLLSLLPVPLARAAETPPNVVLVFIDDMGWADFGCFDSEMPSASELPTKTSPTPNIDRLAKEGLRFTQFYVNSPICSPSRTAITTGQYPQRWRINSYLARRELNKRRGIADWLDTSAPTLARFLSDAGYATGHFGKWHMGGQRDVGEAPGIDEYGFDASLTNFEGLGPRVLPLLNAFDGKSPRKHALGSDKLGRGPILWENRSVVTAAFVADAIDFIDQAEQDGQPFYINLWPDDVHSPFFPPKELRGDQSKRQLYLGALRAMDDQLGRLFDRIRKSDTLATSTLILICSDNGPEQGAGSAAHLRGLKTMLYEGGVRSPLVVWGAMTHDAAHGSVNDTSVFSAIDFVPSLLAVTQTQPPDDLNFDGESLPRTLLGFETKSRQAPLFFRRPPDRDRFYGVDDLPDLAVRDGQWKLLCEYDGSQAELYDLSKDAAETKNIAEAHPDITRRLVDAVTAWHESLPQDRGAEFGRE